MIVVKYDHAQYLQQLRSAQRTMQRWHERAIALGAKWDGQDGYLLEPEAFEQLRRDFNV